MHKMIASVFKILFASLMLMFILDTTLVVVGTLNVHNRVTKLAGIIQNEVARNNCVPSELYLKAFLPQLLDIQEKSDGLVQSFDTNMVRDLTYKGKTYASLEEEKARNYGDIADLCIYVTITPTQIYFRTGGGKQVNSDGSLLSKVSYEYTLWYTYSVPCLRYLK